MKVIAIVAVNKRNVIGNAGDIPWKCPEDLRYFKETTLGHTVVMGRKTADSLPYPLPRRHNLVMSHSKTGTVRVRDQECFHYFKDAEWALESAGIVGTEKVFIIGGAEIYRQFAPMVDELYCTHIDDDSEGDTVFPMEAYRDLIENGEVNTITLSDMACVYHYVRRPKA